MIPGQLDHGNLLGLEHGVVRPPSPVAVGDCGGAVLAVGRQQTLGVALTESHNIRGLGNGKVVFQYAVEHFDPCLFSLIQLYIPHGMTFSLNS